MNDRKKSTSVLAFYRDNKFNPVPIGIENRAIWEEHVSKRRNLYEQHLGLPFSFLRDRSVIEFGCNSGENSLVLAAFGAKLTLAEPNEQVLPRLKQLYEHFRLSHRIEALVNQGVDEFKAETTYDLAIAEGFLYTHKNRNEMLRKIVDVIVPGGIGVISFNDRYGMFFE